MKRDLRELRTEIEELDLELVEVLAARMDAVRRLGTVKRSLDLPVDDLEREKRLDGLYVMAALHHGLDPLLVRRVFSAVRASSKALQRDAA